MRFKFIFSLGAIAVVLLVAGIISVLEYIRISEDVKRVTAGNIKVVALSQNLSQALSEPAEGERDLKKEFDSLNTIITNELKQDSEDFERGFYRSIVPGIVAIGGGVLLVFMLLFFILVYYVVPIEKILSSLDNYRSFNRRYDYSFEGDEQLSELNRGIRELTEENQQLKKKIRLMSDKG